MYHQFITLKITSPIEQKVKSNLVKVSSRASIVTVSRIGVALLGLPLPPSRKPFDELGASYYRVR
jgi:hypothetical protein